MKQVTRSKRVYVEEWTDYIKSLNALCWTHDKSLSQEVKAHIDALTLLVPRIADDKGLRA